VLSLVTVLMCSTGLSLAGAPAASAAQCSYHDWGSSYPLSLSTVNGQKWEDAGIWISLRRTTGCGLYVVIVNKQATNRSTCQWDVHGVITPFNATQRTTCPSQGHTFYSDVNAASAPYTGVATLYIGHNYPNACGNDVDTFVGSSGQGIAPQGLRSPRCGG
jgi:hypothetical protein